MDTQKMLKKRDKKQKKLKEPAPVPSDSESQESVEQEPVAAPTIAIEEAAETTEGQTDRKCDTDLTRL